MAIKEYSSRPEDQISLDFSKSLFTKEVVKVSRIWHFPDPNPPDSNADVINELFQTAYRDAQWFAGDVVPFKTCLYIVKMRSGFEADKRFSRYTF